MKIRDVIAEAGLGQAVGKAAQGVGSIAGAAAGAAQVAKKGFKQGQDTMDKILNPKRWFSKDQNTDTQKTTSRSTVAEPYENRRILQQAGQGRPLYQQDLANLKLLHRAISSGEVSTNIDQTSLLLALKSAYRGQALNDNQKKLLMQFSQQF